MATTTMAMAMAQQGLASLQFSARHSPASSPSFSLHSHPIRLSSFHTQSTNPFGIARIAQTPPGIGQKLRAGTQLQAVRAAVAEPKKVLIVNTNSGGHAVIGFWTAKDLVAAGNKVTVLTVGEESSDKMKKTPFSRFNELRDMGVTTVWGEPSDVGAAVGSATFDVVLDNNGKTLDVVQPVADWAKANGAKQFLFISSAGIYKGSIEQPHVEGDAVKEDAGHKQVENYLAGLGLESWASFRPQYMTGDGNNKDCEEWFFDRISRGRPVCIPAPGIQVTNISHVRDLSSMLALAVQKPDAANGSIFNAVSDRGTTFDGLVRMCSKAAGKEAKIVHYDPKAVGVDAKKAFPFRNMHFYAEPRAAKTKLGWESTTSLAEDLKERYAEYVKIGRDKKDLKFELDDKILEAVSQPVAAA